jgi:cell division transport system permease protein
MGVAISLPSGLYLMLGNLNRLAGELPAQPEISVFLATEVSAAHRQAIAARLKRSDIAQARYVPKDEALAALSAAQDLADITAGLTQNPLPDAWVVRPQATSREDLSRVANDLGKLPGVAETHLDSQWADRLQAALAFGRTGVWLLAGLFAIALIAISGNAIRAQVLARRDEIHVSRLIGATDRYIRRPFLYLGALQALLGGLAAGAVLAVAGAILRAPVEHLAGLYGSAFHLHPPSGIEIAAVLGLTTLFGWLGAWISVARTLHQVETAR